MHNPEHVEVVRSINRLCKGPLRLSGDEADRAVRVHKRKLLAAILSKGGPATKKELKEKSYADLFDLATAAGVDTRAGCGFDVNELILSQPLDGDDYDAPCPNCGTVIAWRAPEFED